MSGKLNPHDTKDSSKGKETAKTPRKNAKRGRRSGPRQACLNQTERRTIISWILPIAMLGLRPLGQAFVQFMMGWQRKIR